MSDSHLPGSWKPSPEMAGAGNITLLGRGLHVNVPYETYISLITLPTVGHLVRDHYEIASGKS